MLESFALGLSCNRRINVVRVHRAAECALGWSLQWTQPRVTVQPTYAYALTELINDHVDIGPAGSKYIG